ncbi:hypothetical protein vB_RpoS-V16_38 [Ruegeria phage vB_RpoS-V16]|uniref:deoxyribonucleoside 5' monophosphate phosphatase n=1 Tax=Ruegeria phage vB_RpoS-V16 TaxID=2218618 RepID=UPI000DCAD80E|nr:deoxyribonucleoside 5' monophosphate phosphatase [Ruegeria phage vB_RpoS-V16]AWY09474.1 hypothetical protein vB_RpoS-V16_38 [Ruegeria phage vB_RpoS-V16]
MAWTGSRMIDVLNPDPHDIILGEVATGLSREPRYGGAATAVFWSVAQHCLLADDLAVFDGIVHRETRLAILLHDAPEYMLRDIISPVKRFLPDYRDLEDVWWRATAHKFGLPKVLPGIVKHYDMVACSSEKKALISPEAGEWPGLPEPRPIPESLLVATPFQVARMFVARVSSLLPG